MLTPVADSQGLLLPCVEHRADDHETRRDGALTHTQDEAHRKQTTKVRACSVQTQSGTPNENIDAVKGDRRLVESCVVESEERSP